MAVVDPSGSLGNNPALTPAAPTQGVQPYTPPTNPNTQPGATTTYANPSSQWYNALFEHYLGRDANPTEVNQLKSQGWNYDRLYQHLRTQGSWIKGVSIGALEDYHK